MISSTRNHEDIFQSSAFRRSCPKVFYNSFLNNFEKFMMKHMRQVFFVKVTSLTLLKIDSSTGVFCKFCNILKNNSFVKHIGTAAAKKISVTTI